MTDDNYTKKFDSINNKIVQDNIRTVFGRNEIIDAFNLIFRHLPNLKSSAFEKLINIMTKVNYQDNEIWKRVLRQYLLYLSLLKTDYQPLKIEYIALILSHLKNNFKMLTFSSDTELEKLIEKAINKSLEYLLDNINKAQIQDVIILVSSISKLGLLDENNSLIIENYLTPKMQQIDDKGFINLLYCFCKNKCASDKFYNVLGINYYNTASRSEAIILKSEGDKLNPFLISQIAKCILSINLAFYVGLKNNKSIFQLVEKNFIKYSKRYEGNHAGALAHSIICMQNCSEEFCYKFNDYLSTFKPIGLLTEMLVFQINYIFMIRGEFSIKNIVTFFEAYKRFIDENKVKIKQAKVLTKLIQYKIQANKNDRELVYVLNENLTCLIRYINKIK